jgi:hypothetical protein
MPYALHKQVSIHVEDAYGALLLLPLFRLNSLNFLIRSSFLFLQKVKDIKVNDSYLFFTSRQLACYLLFIFYLKPKFKQWRAKRLIV